MPTLRCILAFALVLAAAGCATKKIAPPPAELRTDLDPLGIVSPGHKPLNSPDAPVKGVGTGALVGAGPGAGGTFVGTAGGFCQTGDPFACAVGIVLGAALAPVGAVIGAGVGASKSHSSKEVEAADRIMIEVAERSKPNRDLVAAFRERASKSRAVTFVDVVCIGRAERCTAEAGQDRAPRFALRLEYSRYVLHAVGRIDPDISIRATIDAKIFDLATGAPIYRRQWGFRSVSRPYFEVTEDEGAVLAKLIMDSHATVAATVVRDLLEEDEPAQRGVPKAGSVWTKDGPLADEPKEGSDSPETAPEPDPGGPARLPET